MLYADLVLCKDAFLKYIKRSHRLSILRSECLYALMLDQELAVHSGTSKFVLTKFGANKLTSRGRYNIHGFPVLSVLQSLLDCIKIQALTLSGYSPLSPYL